MSIFPGLVTDSQKIWGNIIVKGKICVSVFSTLVIDMEKSQYYITVEVETMQIRQDVSIFPGLVIDSGKSQYYITVEGKDMCMNFPQIVTDSGKIYRNIIVEEERLD